MSPKMTVATILDLMRVLPVILIPNYDFNFLKLNMKIKTLHKAG